MTLTEDPDVAVAAHELSEIVESTESTEPIARHEVETSEARFRSIFDSTTRGLLLLGSDGEPRMANAAFAELFAIEDVETLTLSTVKQRCVSDGQFSELQEQLDACLAGGSSRFDVTIDVRRGTGTAQHHLSVRCNPVIAGGSVDGVLVEFVEVTEQLHSRRDEERSRARMEAAQRIAQVGHWERSLRTGAIHWSDELYRILGLDPAQELPSAERFRDALHPDDRQRVMGVVHDALAAKHGYEIRYRVARKNGSVRVVDEVAEISLDHNGKPLRLLGVVHDVTEQVSAQRALVESEARFRTVFETSANGLALVGRDGEIRTANHRFWQIVGSDAAQSRSIQSLDLPVEDGQGELETVIAAEFAGRGTSTGALRLQMRRLDDGAERVLRVDVAPHVTNGWVDSVLLEVRDITSLMRTRQQLELSAERLALAEEIAHFGYWDWDLVTGEMACSEELHRIFGLPEHGVGPTPELFIASVHPRDRERVQSAMDRTASGGAALRVRHRVVRPSGEVRHVDTVARLMSDEAETVRRLVGTVHDVTDEVAAQQALVESEARLSRAQTNSRMAGWEYELSTGDIWSNGEVSRLFAVQDSGTKLTLEAVMGAMNPADREPFKAAIRAGQQGNGRFDARFRFLGVDDLWRVFWVRGELARDEQGSAVRWSGTIQEITDLAEAEEALAITTQRLRLAQSQASIGSYGRDLTTDEAYWSEEMYRLFGHEPGDLEPTIANMLGFMHEDDRKAFGAAVQAGEHGNGRYDQKNRFVLAGGEERVFWQRGELTRADDGTPLRWDGTCQDVTELVAAQRALGESEEQLQFAQSIAHIGSWGRNLKRADGYWSDEFFRLLGLEPGSVKPSRGNFLKYMHPDDRATFLELVGSASDGYDLRIRFIGADGVERILWMHGELTRDEHGEPLRWDGTGQDVTELVAAERALEDSESRINLVFDSVGTGLAIIGPDRRALVVNQACSEILGYSADELTAVPFDYLVHPDDLAMMLESFQQRLEGVPALQERVGTRLVHADGRVVEADLRATPFRVGDTVVGVLVEFRDVTVESALHRQVAESAEQIDAILEATPDALIVADADDVILRVNAATKVIFGWEPEALVGQPVSVLVGGVDRAAHAEYVNYYKETGKPSTPEGLVVGNFRRVTGRRANGFDFPAELAVAETGMSDGRKLFVVAIRDISERQAAEEQVGRLNAEVARRSEETQALVQQLLTAQEEERRTVAYDIHDGPAQQLAAAQMFLQAFVHDAAIVPAEAPNLMKAKQHLEEGLNETRRIMSGLRPAMLDDLGLADALRQLLVELTKQAGVELEFDANGLEVGLPPTVEITLYRVAQEAVSNALKHSGSKHLVVRLTSARDGVRLEVQDRGAGFEPTSVRSPSEGKRFGLVGMRERVTLLGGSFEIESRPGDGATVRVEIPFGGGK